MLLTVTAGVVRCTPAELVALGDVEHEVLPYDASLDHPVREATVKGTIAVVGAGLPGGKLEPIDGLGDRAYMGPVGSFLYVRRRPAWVQFDLRPFSGTREQALALARRLVSKL